MTDAIAGATRFDIDGATLHVEATGTGAPIVLVHAGIADARMWDPIVPALAADHRVVRYDLRGYGRSTIPPQPFAHHDDLAAIFGRLDLGPAVVIGASYGGEVAAALAIERPELVRALVLVNTLAGMREPSEQLHAGWRTVSAAMDRGDVPGAVEIETRMWVDGPHRQPAEVDARVRERVTAMNAAIFARIDEVEAAEERELDPPVVDRLDAIAAPTLIVLGALDQPDATASATTLAAGIPHARLVTIPDAAHLPSLERPEAFTQAVRAFLASVRAERPARP
jgi:pimeloyl-ACP methyl ester carboxylesterase